MSFVEASKIDEIPTGKMKHVEVEGKEIMIVNVDGIFYAVSDRCGHMNALLSMGELNGSVVKCPFHGARFDVTTGKKISDPILEAPPGIEHLPEGFQKYLQQTGELMAPIKTYDLETYEVKIEDNKIKIKL